MNRIDESIKNGTNTIYAETTNMDEIEYSDMKKGSFDNIILAPYLTSHYTIVKDVLTFCVTTSINLIGKYCIPFIPLLVSFGLYPSALPPLSV